MALTAFLQLETHPAGTLNLNGIINGNWEILDAQFGKISGYSGITTIAYAATIHLQLSTSKPFNQTSLTGNVIVAVDEKAAGLSRILILRGDGTERTVTWPAGAVWDGEPLDSVPIDGVCMVMVTATGTTDAGLVLAHLGGGGGGAGATPAWVPDDEDLACNLTTADEDDALASWAGFAAPPAGRVDVLVSRSRHATVGDGAKDKECYFSDDSGTTALAHADIADATTFHWMGSIAGYELSTADTITFLYSTV
jgi:hypothetical protein